MEITAIETIELQDMDISETMWMADPNSDDPNEDEHYWAKQLLFVRVHTGTGLVGLGETYYNPAEDARAVHNQIAPELLGKDPHNTEDLWRSMYAETGLPRGGGSDFRALSAIDIALWDIKGKAFDAPIYELLGGRTNETLRTYNTCYERDYSFMEEPVALAESLLDDGIKAMKIWPYDELAYRTDGQYISPEMLETGAEPLANIREALGTRMDVAIELHGHWNLQCAKRIATHLDQYDPMWIEELLDPGDLDSYDAVARATSSPIIISERLGGKHDYTNLFANVDVDITMFDLEWVGGLTEARKISMISESHHRPIAPHNCGGPVLHFANLHLGAAVPNLMIMESVRGRYDGWHRDFITEPATAEDGELLVPEEPGLGTELDSDVPELSGATLTRTER